MRKILVMALLLVPTLLTAQEISYMELEIELIETLNDLEIALEEISLAQKKQKQAWIDSNGRMNDFEESFNGYKIKVLEDVSEIILSFEKDHVAEVRALKIGNWITTGIAIFVTAIIGRVIGMYF